MPPSTYYAWKERFLDPEKRSDRAKRDALLKPKILEIWTGNFGVYGVLKVWHELLKSGEKVARCTVARLMKELGLQGVRRGRRYKVTTRSDDAQSKPKDLVDRNFTACRPDELWVSVGDSYDNALAETIIGLFKTEIIWPLGPWGSSSEVEVATFEWVDWYNNRRLFSSLHYKTPTEVEQAYYQQQPASDTMEVIT